MSKKSSKASIVPLLVAVFAIVLSLGISFLTRNQAHAFGLHLVGYLLTPLVVALAMGLDSIDQRKKTGSDAWFEKNKRYFLGSLQVHAKSSDPELVEGGQLYLISGPDALSK